MFSQEDIITGEKIQELCDIYCGTANDLQRNPRIFAQTSKHVNLEILDQEIDNPRFVFCYSCSLNLLQMKLHLFKNPFILVSHNEDNNITESYTSLANSDKVIKWFAQNLMMNHPKLSWIPIGLPNSMWKSGNLSIFVNKITLTQYIQKESYIHFFFLMHTNPKERELCKAKLEEKGLVFSTLLPYEVYLDSILHYKWGISPDGNGIDCHRTWEYLYMGIVPILKRSIFSENLQKLFPCILLDKWDDLNMLLLEKDFSQQFQESHKFLKFSYWKDTIFNTTI
jgi:hypothetical protein